MSPRPTGTVTFLFTDIQGSTRLWQAQAEAMKRSHARHNEILRAAIESNEGYVFEVVGDAFCAAFASAEYAAQAAVSAQLDLGSEAWGEAVIRVRMGIHTGKADLRENGLYSGYTTLSRAQRMMSAAHGGQCLLSSTSEPLVRDSLPEGVVLRDLGDHRLKEVPHAERIFELVIPGLAADFPPIRTLDVSPNNLPIQLTSFIGREKELADVTRLLAGTRLLTLTGPGGTGKSRLALRGAADLLQTFPHGAWLVELAPVSDASLVANAALAALNLPAEIYRPAIDMLCDYLAGKDALLILDNCEHLVEACAGMVDRLLHTAPRLRIIITSREALGIAGEVTYRVPSLELPELMEVPTPESISLHEAVRLFIDRAAAALPTFTVTNGNAPAVAQVCRRLDGIPLAIELAAAKVRTLRVEQIAKRLDDRFRLLTGGSRTALERHQTLRAMLDWSHNLLPVPEQVLFRRLATFVNGCTLEAAETVCAGEALDRQGVLELLEQLVNKSLISADEWRAETRYRMLETMHQYAVEKLIEAGESELLRERHLQYFLELAETAAPHLVRPEQLEWLGRLEGDHDNLRAALEWSLGKKRPESALRLTAALGVFWYLHSHCKEGARWLERSLDKVAQDLTRSEKLARGRAFYHDALLADFMDSVERVQTSAEAAFALTEEGGDRRDLAIATFVLSIARTRAGDREEARRLYERSLAEFRELNDLYWIASALYWNSNIQWVRRDLSLAEQFEICEAAVRSAGERVLLAELLGFRAIDAAERGDLKEAQDYLAEAEALYEEVGNAMGMGWPPFLHGLIAHIQNDLHRARSMYLAAVRHLELLGERGVRSGLIANLGIAARQAGDLHEAQMYTEQAIQMVMHVGGLDIFVSERLAHLAYLNLLQGQLQSAKSNFRESLSMEKSNETRYPNTVQLVLVSFLFADRAPRVAARILSAVDSFRTKASNSWLDPIFKLDFESAIEDTRSHLDAAAFQAAWSQGAMLSPYQALELALKALDEV